MRKSPDILSRTCSACGTVYKPTGNSQKFCKECSMARIAQQKRDYIARKFPDRTPKKKRTDTCCICGAPFASSFEGKPYCNKHYLRLHNNGTLIPKERKRTNTYKILDNTVIIATKKGQEFIIDISDFEAAKCHSWCFRNGYAVANIDGKVISLHRFLLQPPAGVIVDHINGNTADNRRCNLRLCSQKDNSRNVSVSYANKVGVLGIRRVKSGKYEARIMVDRKTISLGRFDTLEEAVIARQQGEIYYFGEFSPSVSRNSACRIKNNDP